MNRREFGSTALLVGLTALSVPSLFALNYEVCVCSWCGEEYLFNRKPFTDAFGERGQKFDDCAECWAYTHDGWLDGQFDKTAVWEGFPLEIKDKDWFSLDAIEKRVRRRQREYDELREYFKSNPDPSVSEYFERENWYTRNGAI